MVQHLKATAGARNQSAKRDAYSKKPWSKWDDDQRQEASTLYMNAGYKKCILKYGDHAKKKTQTHATFEHLCDEILKRGIDVKRAANLPEDTPIVEVIDNVPSHIDRQQLTKVDDNLYRYKDPCLYLFLGSPKQVTSS